MTTLKVGQLAKEAGVNIQTIHYYERRGLIPEPPRQPSGYRDYSPDFVARIRFIKKAQELGFSLAEIAELLDLRIESECVVAGLVINEHGKTFVQKRSPDRRLFPNCWDIVGGHVDPGETLYEALAREIAEETGWRLKCIVDLATTFDWSAEQDGVQMPKREFDFLVEVDGHLDQPKIEEGKFSEWRWIGLPDVEILKENREAGEQAIYEVVRRALALHLT